MPLDAVLDPSASAAAATAATRVKDAKAKHRREAREARKAATQTKQWSGVAPPPPAAAKPMRGRSKTTKASVHVLHWAEQPVSALVGMATSQRAQTRLNIRATAAKTKAETGDGLKQVMALLRRAKAAQLELREQIRREAAAGGAAEPSTLLTSAPRGGKGTVSAEAKAAYAKKTEEVKALHRKAVELKDLARKAASKSRGRPDDAPPPPHNLCKGKENVWHADAPVGHGPGQMAPIAKELQTKVKTYVRRYRRREAAATTAAEAEVAEQRRHKWYLGRGGPSEGGDDKLLSAAAMKERIVAELEKHAAREREEKAAAAKIAKAVEERYSNVVKRQKRRIAKSGGRYEKGSYLLYEGAKAAKGGGQKGGGGGEEGGAEGEGGDKAENTEGKGGEGAEDGPGGSEANEAAVRLQKAWRVRRMMERVPGECLQRQWVLGYENSVSYVMSGKHGKRPTKQIKTTLRSHSHHL